MSARLKGRIISSFKLYGLSLRSGAVKYLTDVLQPVSEVEVEKWLDTIVNGVQKLPLTSSFIDRDCIELAVQNSSGGTDKESDKVFEVIDAFRVPRLSYNIDRKKFVLNEAIESVLCLHASADAKAELFKERFTVLHQRTLRHELFTPPAAGASVGQQSKKFQLRPVEYLLGTTSRLGRVIVLGMLIQLKEGKYFLEDPTGSVELDLSQATFHTGIFTEYCFVLAEGMYDDGIFHVSALGFPPAEASKATRSYFGNMNFFGGSSATSAKSSSYLAKVEAENPDAMFVFLSDVWLDQPKVMDKLRVLFSGYADMLPTAFVFCGHFCSAPYGPEHARTVKKCFRELADLVCEFESLAENCRFVFVPGPLDPGPGNILPRPPIPDILTEDIRGRLPLAVFASNPCRIQFCTQEIVVFREDITNKMCRNCVRFPSDKETIPTHLVKTVNAQAHLCPLPLHVRPLYWSYDNALRVYPLPDLIVFADKYDPFQVENADCISINPGSFPKTKFQFKVYWPQRRLVEDSQIPD
ncbi:DNA polymerase epsilon subunit 2-like [Corticium candelabrum]|uniref:DNA polymerase epsilon subunit 2-like n=1 Tax=Corticium candelabrum TaxID=121492 RepID=UPI002E252D56|nr:DNA polymerase epsilon subunit 2-like [Corticium candelabrum]